MATYFSVRDDNGMREKCLKAPVGSQVLFDVVKEMVGMKKNPSNDIPYAIEVDGWGELACEGEVYETEDFAIEAISEEEYENY